MLPIFVLDSLLDDETIVSIALGSLDDSETAPAEITDTLVRLQLVVLLQLLDDTVEVRLLARLPVDYRG
jgi:hypothetical protein